MTTSLTPDHALAFLREFSADFRAGIVLDARQGRLAGPVELHVPARALLDARPRAHEMCGGSGGSEPSLAARVASGKRGARSRASARMGDGVVFAARASEHAIVVVAGPLALEGVTRRDIRTVLSAMGSQSVQESVPERLEVAVVNALVTAAADAFSRHSAD